MADGRKERLTLIAERLAEHIDSSVALLKQVLDPGIGMEEIDSEEFRRRFSSATPEQRQILMESVGGERALTILSGGNSDN